MKTYITLIASLLATLSLSAQQPRVPDSFIIQSAAPGNPVITEVESLCSVTKDYTKATRFRLVAGFKRELTVSIEMIEYPGNFLRHQYSRIKLHPYPEHDLLFQWDATFKLINNSNGTVSFQSANYPEQYITVTEKGDVVIAPDISAEARSFFLR